MVFWCSISQARIDTISFGFASSAFQILSSEVQRLILHHHASFFDIMVMKYSHPKESAV
jgi:hypothetical protein